MVRLSFIWSNRKVFCTGVLARMTEVVLVAGTLKAEQVEVRNDIAEVLAQARKVEGDGLGALLAAQHVYKFFASASIDGCAQTLVRRCAKKLGLATPATALLNLRLAIDQGECAPVTADQAIVLSGEHVDANRAAAVFFVVSVTLVPSADALLAHRLRSFALPITALAGMGFSNPSGAGRRESTITNTAADANPASAERTRMLAGARAMPHLFAARLAHNPVVAELLISERRAVTRPTAVPDQSGEPEASAPAAPMDRIALLRAKQRAAWLTELLSAGAFELRCLVAGPLDRSHLGTRTARLTLPFAPAEDAGDAAVWASLGQGADAPASWPYLLATSAGLSSGEPVRAPPEPAESNAMRPAGGTPERGSPVLLEEPVVVPEEVPMPDAPVARAVTSSEVAVAVDEVAVHNFYEPLREFAQRIQLAQLTVYELETYARERLHWHVSRAAEYASADDSRPAQRRTPRTNTYPQRSGAHRALLRRLGSDVVRRESQHEAIGLGALALAAAPVPELRESLLFFEALGIEASQSISTDRETVEAMVDARLALIERFWQLCEPVLYSATSTSVTERALAAIARDWRHTIASMPENAD